MVLFILGDPGAVSGGGKKSKRARKNSGEENFSSPESFLARLDFFPPPLTAPGSLTMGFIECKKDLKSDRKRVRKK